MTTASNAIAACKAAIGSTQRFADPVKVLYANSQFRLLSCAMVSPLN